jgi:hypothetical protein
MFERDPLSRQSNGIFAAGAAPEPSDEPWFPSEEELIKGAETAARELAASMHRSPSARAE